MTKFEVLIKRLLDLLVSLLLLVMVGWLILLCIIIATIDTGAFGLYYQERIGKNLKQFSLMKIRSMRIDKNNTNTTTLAGDPRVTSFGNIIRRLKIDELPQVINVLIGNMSLVGPRPTVMEDVIKMSDEQKNRFKVKPGITGLAQVNGNTSLNWPARIKFDLQYINEYSIFSDFRILMITFLMVMTNKAETHPTGEDEWQ